VKVLAAHELHEGILRDAWLMEASSVERAGRSERTFTTEDTEEE
jgi:hypothetical protein